MITFGLKLGPPGGGGGGGGGGGEPDTVNCSHVLGAPRLAIRTPAMLRSAETHWLLDIAWNATTGVNHVPQYEWSGGGGIFAAMFDGTEELLSIDIIHWYEREIYAPN